MATFAVQPAYISAMQQQQSNASASGSGSGSGSGSTPGSASYGGVQQTDQRAHGQEDGNAGGKKKSAKRRKVNHACLYCRRSHMTCDEGRPCQRCIKREIGHLCHDEARPPKSASKPPESNVQPGADGARVIPQPAYGANTFSQAPSAWPTMGVGVPQGGFLYQPETLGNEFSMLSDVLETLDDGSFFTPPPTVSPSLMATSFGAPPSSDPQGSQQPQTTDPTASNTGVNNPNYAQDGTVSQDQQQTQQSQKTDQQQEQPVRPASPEKQPAEEPAPPLLPSATKTERFLLTAADQESGSRDERLNRVIRSKYEAGLLKPYNYVKGYARLSRWMDRNVSQQSKQQILQPLSVLRPKFRAVAQSLRDIDLVFIEEAFERMLLDYDRVFSAMGVPACLWRRTGEIYKGNREFTELVGLDGYMMRDGRVCIYELMAEESAVNYWEKYGHVAFDSTQKAVLTSCVLRYKPHISTYATSLDAGSGTAGALARRSPSRKTGQVDKDKDGSNGSISGGEEGFVSCCFSFTIRRDKWGIPSMIVGNFIRC